MNKLVFWVIALLPTLSLAQKPELMVPLGHTKTINSITFSPNQKYILTTAYEEPNAILWDRLGNELHTFEKAGMSSVHFSSDGQYILAQAAKEVPVLIETEFGPEYDYQIQRSVALWTIDGLAVPVFDELLAGMNSVIFSADGQFILSGGSDGQVSTWDLKGTKISSFIAHENKINSLEISANGRFLITRSEESETIGEQKLWDLKKQKLVQLLDHKLSMVTFSPQGNYLIEEAFFSNNSVQVLDLKGQNLLKIDSISSAYFSPDDRYILSKSRTNNHKIWTVKSKKTQPLGRLGAFAFSPNGQSLIYKKQNSTPLQLMDLNKNKIEDFPVFNSPVDEILFTPDSRFFVSLENNASGVRLNLFSLASKELQATTSLPAFYTLSQFSPDGQILLIKGSSEENDSKLLTLNLDLNLVGSLKGSPVDMSRAFISFKTPSIIWEEYPQQKSWDLTSNQINTNDDYEEQAFYSHFTGDVLRSPQERYIFGAAADEPNPKLYDNNGGPSHSFDGHNGPIFSASFSSDGEYLLTGSFDNTAKLWSLDGTCLQTFSGHSMPVGSVAFSKDQQLFLTGTNKMAKLWRRGVEKELISLIQYDSLNWIVTTPNGLFDASPGAMNLLNYSVFYERDQEYILIDVEQLKARYYEPGLLQKTLNFINGGIRPVEVFENVSLYPKVTAEILGDELNIQLQARNGGIGKVSLFINGKEIAEEINPIPRRENAKRDSLLRYNLKQHQNYLLRHPDSINIVSIRAYNAEAWLKSPSIDLEYKIAKTRAKGTGSSQNTGREEEELLPKLFVISIGTSDYSGTQLDLQYADQDATMMAKALESVGTALFSNSEGIEVFTFTTADADSTGLDNSNIIWQYANKKNIESAFQTIKTKAKAEDVIVVYLSGHGVTYGNAEQALFHYLTAGIASEDLSDAAVRKAYTISSDELTKWTNDIPALKQVLIIDACNSGQIVENLTSGTKNLNSSQIRALDRMKDRTGIFVLSGSAADKVSYEASEYGQGLLTYALLQGMLGLATQKDKNGKEVIDVMKLFQHARDQVPLLATSINGIQTPMLAFPKQGASFDIGILDENAKKNISIGAKKPVIVQSTFVNEESYRDDLGIANLLELALRKETEKGKDASFIYVDVFEYPKAYSLGGLYKKEADGISLKVKLFQGDANPILLDIPTTDDPKKVVRYLIRALKKIIK